MTQETKSLQDLNGHSVEFKETQMLSYATARLIPLYLSTPEHFDQYRKDARRVIRVLMEGGSKKELERLAATGLNAMGINNLLAAMAYEILECSYQTGKMEPEDV